MRKTLIIVGFLTALTGAAHAQYGYGTTNRGSVYGGSGLYGTGSNPNSTTVDPYTRRDGTHVDGYHRTTPNDTQLDNYGTRGNLNPYTGTYGTRQPRY